MVSYKPLWHLLVERQMSKHDLMVAAKISPNTMTKLRKDEDVALSILNKICATLNVQYGDIMEYIPSDEKEVM